MDIKERVPTVADAVRIVRGVGGKAFPKDWNWICPKGHESRSYETTCYTCFVDAEQAAGWR